MLTKILSNVTSASVASVASVVSPAAVVAASVVATSSSLGEQPVTNVNIKTKINNNDKAFFIISSCSTHNIVH